MGKLIQCSSRLAKKPYYFRVTDTNVYSIEEVCYFIHQNIYMLQRDFFTYGFAVWLREELGMEDTALKVENMLRYNNNLKDIVVTLCCSCDYYDEKEINWLIKIMDETQSLPMRKRQKIKADNFLRCNLFEKALEEYGHILKSDNMLAADIKEYGAIYHNIGVAYAGLGDYGKACDYFSQAYEKGKNKESIREYIYCLILSEDNTRFGLVCRQYNITEEERDIIKRDFNEIDRINASSKETGRISRLREILKSGYLEEYYEKVDGYIKRWKDEYREETSV
ncbi:MAG: tetratricopeptide repeat protein [Lachnospiraceae bacterium]|nr:tetratricopeptide repeat protein [Lachnospiraceae bacterium]